MLYLNLSTHYTLVELCIHSVASVGSEMIPVNTSVQTAIHAQTIAKAPPHLATLSQSNLRHVGALT